MNDQTGWIGLDVGGANLKGADATGRAYSVRFPLWNQPEKLATTLGSLLRRFERKSAQGIAMTMTGELADCFATKSEGVKHIVLATIEAAGDRPLLVATVDDRWQTPEHAMSNPQWVAASNWRLLARMLAEQESDGEAQLVDVGSTTTDIIPIRAGCVVAKGQTDTDRLLAGELLYTGVRRTPVCAVVKHLPYRGRRCPVAAEWFATTADVWLVLGELPEDANDLETADGRPFTLDHAVSRLARCVCADRESFSHEDATHAAEMIAEAQQQELAAAIRSGHCIISGEGEFLARRAIQSLESKPWITSLGESIGQPASHCGPAYAASVLAGREISPHPEAPSS